MCLSTREEEWGHGSWWPRQFRREQRLKLPVGTHKLASRKRRHLDLLSKWDAGGSTGVTVLQMGKTSNRAFWVFRVGWGGARPKGHGRFKGSLSIIKVCSSKWRSLDPVQTEKSVTSDLLCSFFFFFWGGFWTLRGGKHFCSGETMTERVESWEVMKHICEKTRGTSSTR